MWGFCASVFGCMPSGPLVNCDCADAGALTATMRARVREAATGAIMAVFVNVFMFDIS